MTPRIGQHEMANMFVMADPHLFHRNIQKFVDTRMDRWGGDLEAMSEDIVTGIYDSLPDGAEFYMLGDLFFQVGTKKDEVLDMLRPIRDKCMYMHWIIGNHDEPNRCPLVRDLFDDVTHSMVFGVASNMLVLSHYPLDVETDRRVLSIHGHVHGTSHNMPKRLDVGVDSLQGFVPDYEYGAVSMLDVWSNWLFEDIPAQQPGRKPDRDSA